MQRFSFSSFAGRVKTRWNDSWLTDRIELRGGLLGACGHERVQPKIAAFAILGLLVGQTFLPGVMLLSQVQAGELRQKEALEAQKKQREAQTPSWARAVEARVAQEERERNLRLTQGRGTDKKDKNGGDVVNRPPLIPVPGSKPGQVVPSSELDCPDCEIDVRALDLTRVPTEKELRKAGQLGGALNPLRPAEPQELGLKLDKLAKRAGIEGGLKAQLPKKDPRERGLQKAKEKYAQAEAINLDFGKAIQEWNKHNYRQAAKMFEKHMEKFPDSPWGGEAMLHLGCDAKYNGRFDEAQRIYDTILKNTSDKPNKKLKKARKERKSRGGGPDAAELEAEVNRAAQGTQSLEVAVEKLDVASEETDESFELHMKAMARWADLDIATGRWNDAAKKLQHIVATDGDWRRRTWAQNWLTNLTNLGPQATRLAMCGPQALQYVLAGLDKDAAAKKVGAVVPKTLAGLSLAELEKLADQNGTAMTTFKVADETQNKIARLVDLPLPAIVHTDNARGFDESKSYFADRELKRAPLVAVHPDAAKKGVLPTKVAQTMSKDKGGAAVSLAGDLFGTQLPTTGHYLVLEKVDGKTRTARLFDPSAKRYYQLSWEQLAQKWSGKGLALGGKTRLAALSKAESEGTHGGCCGSFEPPSGTGDTPDNQSVCPDGKCPPPYGEPVVSINRTNLNVYARDIPLWYSPGKGPGVELDMSYNSQDGLSQRNAFGNKWMFTYGMYVVEDTQAGGGQVLAVMGDGSVDRYYPNSSGNGYTSQGDNLNRLEKLGPYRYSLTFADGGAALFDIPPGTTSLQPFLLELRDANGYSLTFSYNAQVQLTTITDALGQQTRLQYNPAGYVTKVWDPFGRYASFGYDASGNLTEAIDMEGHSFQYTYDTVYGGDYNSVYLTRLNSAKGATLFSHSYGYPSRDLTVTDVMGNSETFHGEWWGPDRYSYTDKKGVAQGYSVAMTDSYKARVSQERLPDGTTISKNIAPQTGWVTSVTDARGQTTSLQLNGKGQVTQVTDPRGNTARVTYAPNGLDTTSVTNANGVQVASATYNSTHQPLSITDEDGTTTFSYTAWGAPSSVTSPDGKTLSYSYNAKGQVAQINFAGNAVAGFTYDAVGRVKTATDELGTTIGYGYNNLDLVTKVTYPDGTTEETDYTCCALPGVVKDRAGRKSYYDYDPLRRLTRVQDAAGNTLQMDYDREGQMVRLVDAKGNLTKWQYDGLGRVTKKLYHDGQSEELAYSGGLLSQSKNARRQITKYNYDANANLTTIDYPNMADVSLNYNALDNVTQITDGVGTHNFSYSPTGRLYSFDGPFANDTQNYNYDGLGRLISQSLERGTSSGVHTQGYAYDVLERLQSITSSGAGSVGTFTYSYVGTSDLLDTLQLPNGTRTVQSYDSLQRPTQTVNQKNGGALLNKFAYAYDNRDVRTAMQSQHGADPLRQVGYSYDATDQLVGESASGGVAGSNYSHAFSYDAMGNRLKQNTNKGGDTSATLHSVNALNQVTAVSSTTNGGSRATSGLTYDNAGNTASIAISDGSRTVFSYDDADRLFRIEKRSAADAPLSKSEFVYDFASRKAVSQEFTYTAGAWVKNSEKRRVFDGLDVAQERNAQNEVTAQLVRDGNIAGILSRSTSQGATFYGYDGNGNVTLLTDENGDDVGRYRYDAFGNTLEASGARAAENPYRFSTKELHAASGLYDYGYRFYSPGLGRWINRDPIQEAGGVNLYHFVGNSPLNIADDYGLNPRDVRWQIFMRLGTSPAAQRVGTAIQRSRVGQAIAKQGSRAGQAISRSTSKAVDAGKGLFGKAPHQLSPIQGLTNGQVSNTKDYLSNRCWGYGGEIFIQGSRVSRTAKPGSDIDFAIRVDKAQFLRLLQQRFGSPNVGSAKWKTMQHAEKTGKIQAGEAGLRDARKELERRLNMEVDISIIMKGGQFDNGPLYKLR